MKKSKKFLALALLLSVLVVVGCGSGGEQEEAAEMGAETTEADASEAIQRMQAVLQHLYSNYSVPEVFFKIFQKKQRNRIQNAQQTAIVNIMLFLT